MNRKTSISVGVVMLVVGMLFGSCGGDKLISCPQMSSAVEANIEAREVWLPAMPHEATAQELEGLRFLYAYMPVGDVVDYSPGMYLANVRASLKASQEMPWGDTVPNDLFMHYVLPVRINNENLDSSRIAFYDELRDRVKGLSMENAILEVNHWCHEKVIYSSSDGRTMSPSAMVRNAQGRCGEESTFTTAAMRAVGIPARQVYTPRWAHTDDNHAWVEAWANGTWHYVGACEPEPLLNMGWFDGPSKRGMLMHAKVFGDYNGTEEIIAQTPIYTEINITSNYAPVASATVLVQDTVGMPVSGARVDFGIYNYAELYPAVSKVTDADGATKLTAGLGDMVVWATDGESFGYGQLSFGGQDTLVVVLNRRGGEGESYSVDFDLVPPAVGKVAQSVTDEQRAANGIRLKQEDSIRNAYIATWIDKADAFVLANEIGADTSKVWDLVRESRGNWTQVSQFLKDAASDGQLDLAFRLLNVVTVKDLRDTPAEVFMDHLTGAMMYVERPYFDEYILEPRIGNELLTSYRAAMAAEPYDIEKIISKARAVRLVDSLNPGRVPMSVIVAQRLGIADRAGRDGYFIAMARSKGIPARHEPVTGRLQYYDLTGDGDGMWQNVNLDESDSNVASVDASLGTLAVRYSPSKQNNDPKYYSHFTVSKLTGGRYETIELSNPTADMGAGGSMRAIFATPVELEAGDYRLVSGTRMGNGTVLNEVQFFEVQADRQTEIDVTMREDKKPIEVIGQIDTSVAFTPQGESEPISVLDAVDEDYFVLALLAVNNEPTNHALRDVAALGSELEQWGGELVFLFSSADDLSAFDAAAFGALPNTIRYGIDGEGRVSEMLRESLELDNVNDLPLFIVSDTSGRVVFLSQGYRIGLGDQIKRVIASLD